MEITHNKLINLGFNHQLFNDCHDYTLKKNGRTVVNLFKVEGYDYYTITTHSRSAEDNENGIIWETNNIADVEILLGVRSLVVLKNQN